MLSQDGAAVGTSSAESWNAAAVGIREPDSNYRHIEKDTGGRGESQYRHLKLPELRGLLKERGLRKSGNKNALIHRLEEYDATLLLK